MTVIRFAKIGVKCTVGVRGIQSPSFTLLDDRYVVSNLIKTSILLIVKV